MKNKDPFPLKLSLHGMNERMQKIMESYLTLLCSDVATLVDDKEAQAEIIYADSPQGNNLLKERLAKRPSKPIIVISSNVVSSTEVVYVKKPLVVSDFIHALLTVKHMIQSNKALKKSIDDIRLADKSKTVKPVKVSTPSKTKEKDNLDRLSVAQKVRLDQNKIAEEATKLLNQITMIDNISNVGELSKNRRETVRYIFEGVEGSLEIKSLLGRNHVSIQVLDISSKGANIQCNEQIKLNTKALLKLHFTPQQDFKISARVIRSKDKKSYGLIFENYHHELIDFLINSADLCSIN